MDPRSPALHSPAQCCFITFGSLSNPRWRVMRDRLQGYFPAFTSEEFECLHHLNTSHQAEPDRTATMLGNFWAYGCQNEPGP